MPNYFVQSSNPSLWSFGDVTAAQLVGIVGGTAAPFAEGIGLGGGLSLVGTPPVLTMGAGGPYVLKAGDTMTGNLGIGAAAGAWGAGYNGLSVGSSGNTLFGSTSTGEWFLTSNTYYDGTNYKYSRSAAAMVLSAQSDGSLLLRTAASGTAGNNVGWNVRYTINNDGSHDFGGGYVKTMGVGQITTSGWSKGLQLASGLAIEMDSGLVGTGRYFGMGATTDGNVYMFRSTANNNTTAPNYGFWMGTNGVITINGGPLYLAAGGARWNASIVTSSDPNTCDDYEEGTVSPSLSSGTANVSFTNATSSFYLKIGSLVHCWCYLNVTNSTGAPTGAAIIVNGLPFTSTVSFYGAAICHYPGYGPVGGNSLYGYVDAGTTRAYVIMNLPSGAAATMVYFCYRTAD